MAQKAVQPRRKDWVKESREEGNENSFSAKESRRGSLLRILSRGEEKED